MGLFGKMKLDRHRLKPGDTDTWQMGQDGLVQGDTAVTQERLPSYFQGGDKFTGRDALAGVLAAIGDAFAQRGGMQGGAMQNLTGGRMSALKMARDAQQAQLERQQGREDFEWELGKRAEYDKPTPYRWEDNAGNVWERGPDGQNQRIFTDNIPKMYIQGDQALQISNPYAQQSQPALPQVGTVMPDPRKGGGTGNGVGGFPRYRR